MSALSELSGAFPRGLPPQGLEHTLQRPFPFPGNVAVGSIQGPEAGGSESASHQDYIWAAQTDRRPPRREDAVSEFLSHAYILWEAGSRRLAADMGEIKTAYILRNEDAISHFFSSHRTAAAVLSGALPELKKSFGDDVVFNLEALSEDDGSTSLYAIVVWRGPAECAETALEDFDERWWLNQTPHPGLTFTYELA
jgi:hypothetical protein